MNSNQIPYKEDLYKNDFLLNDLINRVMANGRAKWTDIHKDSGVYVIYHIDSLNILFHIANGNSNSKIVDPILLKEKWDKINKDEKTDILYIGRGNVKSRVRSLILFGLGKRKNHRGGEWIWQVNDVKNIRILVSSCPIGKEMAYEKYLLDEFRKDHNGELPLGNRNGGNGSEHWFPKI